jgi:hypothetical protein
LVQPPREKVKSISDTPNPYTRVCDHELEHPVLTFKQIFVVEIEGKKMVATVPQVPTYLVEIEGRLGWW